MLPHLVAVVLALGVLVLVLPSVVLPLALLFVVLVWHSSCWYLPWSTCGVHCAGVVFVAWYSSWGVLAFIVLVCAVDHAGVCRALPAGVVLGIHHTSCRVLHSSVQARYSSAQCGMHRAAIGCALCWRSLCFALGLSCGCCVRHVGMCHGSCWCSSCFAGIVWVRHALYVMRVLRLSVQVWRLSVRCGIHWAGSHRGLCWRSLCFALALLRGCCARCAVGRASVHRALLAFVVQVRCLSWVVLVIVVVGMAPSDHQLCGAKP